jgi:tetratricopeptide (TPR) repeat protein
VEGVVSEVKAMRGLLGALETESRRQLASFTSGRPPTDVEADQTRTAIETIKNNPNADLEMKLRAEAVAASQAKQSEKAYSLWRVLSDYCPQDAKVHFNAGYWAHAIAEQLKPSEALRCFKQACAHYQKALELDPGLHQAAYNWASALDDTAKAELMGGDLASARKLWRQAAEKFESALKLKPDLPEAADNWGIALAAEAKAVHESGDLTGARALWRQAGEKFALALKIKDNKDDAAYNWGLALADEAKAISKTDLAAARAVWHEAGSKYELALKIKPDKCVAADSWGNALAAEAAAVANSNLPNAKDLERTLWEQALAKYQQATEKPDFVNSRFNSACAYAHLGQAKACCDWLAKWKECYPKATKADLDKETDFDGIRGTQEFRVFRDSLPD